MTLLQAIEQALMVITILFVLCGLWLCISILWILASGEIEEYRRAFARLVLKRWERDQRVEAYVKGLRELAEDTKKS